MSEIKRKQYIGEIKEINEEERTIVGQISTEAIDRTNEVVVAKGGKLENYRKNPVVLFAHNYQDLPIGKNIWIKEQNNKLIAKTQFANTSFADDVFNLMKEGFLNAFSIGFNPIKSEDEVEEQNGEKVNVKKWIEWELLEYSVVPVPANPEALQLAVNKGLKINSKELKQELNIKDDIIEKPEPEETENTIRIRVEDPDNFVEDSFRTIDISVDEGIKAVIGKHKDDPNGPTHVQSYIFDKEKGWTVESAQAWVEEHRESKSMEKKSVIPYKQTPKSPEDEEWDAGAEIKDATVEDLKNMCTWYDSENPDLKTSYKLPHHKLNENYSVVWNGVRAAMGAILGSRGGVDIPDEDKEGCYNHLAKHYEDFDKEVPEFRLRNQPIVNEKIGAVLNKSNKKNLQDAQDLIQKVLDSAEIQEDAKPEDIKLEDIKLESKSTKSEDFEISSGEIKEIVREIISEITREEIRKITGKVD